MNGNEILTVPTSSGTPLPEKEPWRRRRLVPHFLRREKVMGQVARFGIVGGLNTAVDYGTFNLLVGVFGVPFLIANPIAIAAGIVNSFLWNKNWTFSAGRSHSWAREALLFIVVSVTGMFINTGGLWLLTTLSGNDALWAVNLQKLAASVVSMTWNFLGYRFLVFGRHFKEKKV